MQPGAQAHQEHEYGGGQWLIAAAVANYRHQESIHREMKDTPDKERKASSCASAIEKKKADSGQAECEPDDPG